MLWGKKALKSGMQFPLSGGGANMSHASLGGLDTPIDPLRGVGVALEIHNGSFAWDMELKAEDLNNINFRADAGTVSKRQ